MSRQIKQKLEDSVMRKVNLFIAMSLDGDNIVGGLGVIVNDFHNKKILHRMYVRIYQKEYRGQGIAGHLLHTVVADMKRKGITPLYLITDLTDFYEKYGWELFCMVQGEEDPEQIRMYIHR